MRDAKVAEPFRLKFPGGREAIFDVADSSLPGVLAENCLPAMAAKVGAVQDIGRAIKTAAAKDKRGRRLAVRVQVNPISFPATAYTKAMGIPAGAVFVSEREVGVHLESERKMRSRQARGARMAATVKGLRTRAQSNPALKILIDRAIKQKFDRVRMLELYKAIDLRAWRAWGWENEQQFVRGVGYNSDNQDKFKRMFE
ncbi:MAG: hypothetical protein NTY46_04840 [Candidatus Sumerlaeota bacterium]|nr:hypothetical protein [Candidatus Sumerlaeota bacterium]